MARAMRLETVMPQSHKRLATIAVLLAGTGACATMKPPAMNNGPALSSNGVQVAVLRQMCGESSVTALDVWIDETERRSWFLFEATGRADSSGH